MCKHGASWRDHLPEIFEELDAGAVPFGIFGRIKIDLGDGKASTVSAWKDLELAAADQRERIIDALRKYI